ncbi:MAG: two-component regulator propeller domain-containing protein [Bacteroidota bacterium]
MKLSLFPAIVLLLAFALAVIFPSCKEKNTEYPPRPWSEYFYPNTHIAARDIQVILYENEHSVWLGSRGKEGLLYLDGYKWNVFNKENTGIDFDSITALTRDGNGNLWIGWKSGLAAFDGSSWKKISLFDGLKVTSILVEGIGNIKVGIKGLSGGMAIFQDNSWSFLTLFNSDIPTGNINTMVSDYEQAVWMASSDKGIFRFKNNTWKNMSLDLPLLSNEFTSLTLAPDGSIWAGSASSQLIHFHNDTATILNTGTSKPITSVIIADNGSLWCSTLGAGLVKFDGQTWTSTTIDNASLPSNDIYCLAKGYAGYLFFGINGGKVLIIKQ